MNLKNVNYWMLGIISSLVINMILMFFVFWSFTFTPGAKDSTNTLRQINLGSVSDRTFDTGALDMKSQGQARVDFYKVYGEIAKGQLFSSKGEGIVFDVPTTSDMYPDDEIDNDGDGAVDEERANGFDDDDDGLIDEDVHTERDPITGYELKGVLWNKLESLALIGLEDKISVEIVRLGGFIPGTKTQVIKIYPKMAVIAEEGKENTTLSLEVDNAGWGWLKDKSWIYETDDKGRVMLRKEPVREELEPDLPEQKNEQILEEGSNGTTDEISNEDNNDTSSAPGKESDKTNIEPIEEE